MEMVKIVHNDYERMADLFHNSKDWTLRFILLFNTYNSKSGEMYNFHKEVQYATKNRDGAISINRDFNYFFEISTKERDSNGLKMSIRISEMDFYLFRDRLNAVLKDIKEKDVFATKDNKVFINSRETYKVGLVFGNYISFEPAISEFNNNITIGVFMYLNSDILRVFIPINELYYLVNALNDFNMFIAAQNMMNYLGRPECGTNLFKFENNIKPNNGSNLSFFNKIGAKEN